MRRGDVVTVAVSGGYGKPRPAIVVQSDLLNDTHASVVVCLVTSTRGRKAEPLHLSALRRRSALSERLEHGAILRLRSGPRTPCG
jgi:mRNA-degrading endonuclease toxin of MazEF toxin-antitoxin module